MQEQMQNQTKNMFGNFPFAPPAPPAPPGGEKKDK
jgi:hypothetical protein